MSNHDERLRALYRRLCADQDLYWRHYFARSLAETASLMIRRGASASTTTEAE